MKIVVARYSTAKTIQSLAAILPLLVVGSAIVLYAPPSPTYGLLFHTAISFSMVLLVLITALTIRQLFFDEGTAVWIEDNRIVHLHKWYQSVDRDKVEKIVVNTHGPLKMPQVVLSMRNGRKMNISAYSLSEPPEEIVERLRKSLAV